MPAAPAVVDAPISLLSFIDGMTPFTVSDADVLINQRSIIRQVGSLVIVNNSVRNTLSLDAAEVFDKIIASFIISSVKVKYVRVYEDFFNGASQFAAISAMPIVEAYEFASKVGLNISMDDLLVIARFEQVKKSIVDFFTFYGKKQFAAGEYPFAENTLNNSKLKITKIGRERYVGNGQYKIGMKKVEKIWEAARPHWLSQDTHNKFAGSISRTSGSSWNRRHHNHDLVITPDSVKIGCQTISRWQVEQAAIDLELNFNG